MPAALTARQLQRRNTPFPLRGFSTERRSTLPKYFIADPPFFVFFSREASRHQDEYQLV
ncbi:hypothetical protein CORC01_06878 [Colletotrichum orchidophilum]|uniref:Uncharacterized protein n=1 Tax=Colletotrichum orchidophilum TaxID=1209926 RepID=A0A1G4B929_9PEZI|nr:uncharacterized protein CORC01_06878 [Colletotrichum orchidophilum]OHE97843.1 hypothetical protein CORC01_06878 [Colletotrichum orchidophilum]